VDSDNSRSRVISSATSFCVSALWSSNIISSHTSLWPVLLSFVTHGNVCIENVAVVGSVWDREGGGVNSGDSAEGASGTFVCGSVVRGVASVYVCDAVAFVSTPVILFV
jgi:hypothetical protein